MSRVGGSLRRRVVARGRADAARRRSLADLPRPGASGGDARLAALRDGALWIGDAPATAALFGDAALPMLQAAAGVLAGPDMPAQLDGEALWQRCPEVYRLGLAAAPLDLAEAYLGVPCWYLGATLKREAADGVVRGQRHWHLDCEDERMLRLLVYLGPVGDGGGPFEYLPAPDSDAARRRGRYRSGYLGETRMAALAEPGGWRAVHGDAGTLVAFDGTRLLHRAQPPSRRDRLSVTFAYASRLPLELRRSSRLTVASRGRLGVDARAAACVPPARRF